MCLHSVEKYDKVEREREILRQGFLKFPGVEKGCIGDEWVKLALLYSLKLSFCFYTNTPKVGRLLKTD